MSLIEKIALKPCPFCGGDAEIASIKPYLLDCGNVDCLGHHYEQDEQGGYNHSFDTEAEAIAAWNNRAALTAIMGEGDGVQQCDHEAAQYFTAWNDSDDFIQLAEAFARHRSTAAAAERARRDKIATAMREEADRLSASGDMAFTLRKWADAIERGEV